MDGNVNLFELLYIILKHEYTARGKLLDID